MKRSRIKKPGNPTFGVKAFNNLFWIGIGIKSKVKISDRFGVMIEFGYGLLMADHLPMNMCFITRDTCIVSYDAGCNGYLKSG